MKAFSVREALVDGWRVVRREPAILLTLTVLQVAVLSIGGGASRFAGPLAHFAAQVAGAALAVGWWRVASRAQRGGPVSLSTITELTTLELLRYFVTTVLLAIVVGVGLLLLLVPGLYLAVRLLFAPLIVVEEKVDPVVALRRSWDLTAGTTGPTAALASALVAINFLGLLCFGVGVFVTMPVSIVAIIHAYGHLRDRSPVPVLLDDARAAS